MRSGEGGWMTVNPHVAPIGFIRLRLNNLQLDAGRKL